MKSITEMLALIGANPLVDDWTRARALNLRTKIVMFDFFTGLTKLRRRPHY